VLYQRYDSAWVQQRTGYGTVRFILKDNSLYYSYIQNLQNKKFTLFKLRLPRQDLN